LIWQGVNATAGEYDGFETLFLADATVLDVATPVASPQLLLQQIGLHCVSRKERLLFLVSS